MPRRTGRLTVGRKTHSNSNCGHYVAVTCRGWWPLVRSESKKQPEEDSVQSGRHCTAGLECARTQRDDKVCSTTAPGEGQNLQQYYNN
jgi:hypothetical protein